MSEEKYHARNWIPLVAPYQKPNTKKGIIQVCNSFFPFLLLGGIALWIAQYSFWYALPFALGMSFFLSRIFIIQHDCGHYSFFASRKLNDLLGCVCSLFTFTPYHYWQREHAYHHAHSGNLDHREMGDMPLMTTEEYLHASRMNRFLYCFIRHPFVLFFFGAPVYFLIKNHTRDNMGRKVSLYTFFTDLTLVTLVIGLSLWIGWQAVLMVWVPMFYLFTIMAFGLFYVQHQFEDNYWRDKTQWSPVRAALHGSSYFKLPKVLQWFTGNIGFHHIHHLSPRVPNYELERCHNENPIFEQEITTLTLRNCWATMKLRFWDSEKEKTVSPKELYKTYRPRFESIQTALKHLKARKKALRAEVVQLRRRFAQHMEKEPSPEYELKPRLIESQLKTLSKMIRRKKIKKQENLQQFEQEIEVVKQLIRRYFPRFAFDKL